MKLIWHINFPANLVFHLDNLSQFSMHTRYKYFEFIKDKISQKERRLLQDYKRFRLKSSWNSDFYIKMIFSKDLKIFFSQFNVSKKIKNIILMFAKDYKELFKRSKRNLTIAISFFNKNTGLILKGLNEIENFFDLKFKGGIDCFLLFDPSYKKGSGGGANLKSKGITVELGDKIRAIPTIWHECAHLLLQQNKKRLGVRGKHEAYDEEAVIGLLVELINEEHRNIPIHLMLANKKRPDYAYAKKVREREIKYLPLVEKFYRNKKLNFWKSFVPQMEKL